MAKFQIDLQENFLLAPYPWITPIYILALKMYSKSHGLLPHYGVQFKISKQQSFPNMPAPKINWSIIVYYLFSMSQHILTLYALIHKYQSIRLEHQAYQTSDVLQTAFLIMILVWRILLSDIVRFNFLLDRDFALGINKLITGNKNIWKI